MRKLRLLLLTDAVGGVWVYSLELARALKGFDIETILAVTGPSPSAEQRSAAGEVKIVETGLPLEWLAQDSGEIARSGDALSRLADSERVDVLQTSSAALVARARLDIPIVAVQHSCVATWWSAVRNSPLPSSFEWQRELVAEGLRRADIVVAPTRAFADATSREYRLDAPVLAVNNGRTASETLSLPQGQFVLTAGRLWDEGKNAATLDRAAGRIPATIYAAGPTGGPNGARIALCNLETLGELAHARLRSLLAARPVYASAALYEPFGLSVLEAAQAACALILSDIATHRELWSEAAIFVDPEDDQGFARAMAGLLEDETERRRLGEAARQRAQIYRPERMARQMAELYRCAARQQVTMMRGAA